MNNTIEYKDLHYDIVDVDNLRFATVSLLEVLFDDSGEPVTERAEQIDKSITYYFEDSTFYSKTIDQLTNLYYELRGYQNQ